ncbi:MAG: hypothetical protein V4438_02810 [Patescibacteria group bacterium]
MEGLENDKSRIDRLRDALYSRKIKIKPSFVLDLHGHKTSAPDKWQEKIEEKPLPEKPSSNVSKKIFWSALSFFVICAGIAVYVYISGANLISASKIQIDIIGPSSISSGGQTDLGVAITNNNDTTIEIADLLLEYPSGTRSSEDNLTPLSHARVSFGDIAPHTTVKRSIKSVLFGEDASSVHIAMSLEYRVPGTTSVFTKDAAYDGLIGSSPLTLSIDALNEVNANQDYQMVVHISSNASEIVKNIILTGTLPYGFEPSSYSINPTKAGVWNLGDIAPHEERMITIKGKIYGTKDEQRFFSFNTGVADEKDKAKIGATIASATHTVDIKKPFLGVDITFGKNKVADYVAKGGEEVDSSILWINNLDVPVYDVSITATLSGTAVDKLRISAGKGFYDSNKGVIIWTKQGDENLGEVPPGTSASTELGFFVPTSFSASGALMANPTATLDVTIKAKRLLESGVPQEIVSTAVKTLKVASDAHFTSDITHTTGPIENQGDIPPQVGKETDYTITWAVTNTFNTLSGAKVAATLPEYVNWNNVVSPSLGDVTYNADSRTVTWNLGEVQQQKGGNPSVRKVSFQVGLTPSTSQIGQAPVIENVANFSASDTFTNTAVIDADKGLSTILKTDPAFTYGNDKVIE